MMKFTSLMHVSYMTDNMEQMCRFYQDTLGLRPKMIMRYQDYADRPQSSFFARAQTEPARICIIYFEIAPGQFLELLDCDHADRPHTERPKCPHFALTVEDIFAAKQALLAAGIPIDSDIALGPTGTYQLWIHDPDGNPFEIMQYTDRSLQLLGNC